MTPFEDLARKINDSNRKRKCLILEGPARGIWTQLEEGGDLYERSLYERGPGPRFEFRLTGVMWLRLRERA